MSIFTVPDLSRFISMLIYVLEFQIFFRPLYGKTKWMSSSLSSCVIYFVLFGVTTRDGFLLVIALHALLIVAVSLQLYREVKTQYLYSLFLGAVFVLSRGTWNAQIMLFFFPVAASLGSMSLSLINDAVSVLVLYLMRKFFVNMEKQRVLPGNALVFAVFPPSAMFAGRVAIYHYVYVLAGSLSDNVKEVFTLIGFFLGLAVLVALAAEERYFFYADTERELERAQEQLHRQYLQFSEQRANDEKIKSIYHDMANHMSLLAGMQSMDAVRSYAQEISAQTARALNHLDTGNETLNLLLSQKLEKCAELGISLESAVRFPAESFLQPMEICTLFANPIDNAMEAIAASDLEDRTIRVSGGERHGCCVLRFENAFSGTVDEDLHTHKEGGIHGYGLKNVKAVLEQHEGSMHVQFENGRFVLTMLIPIPGKA